MKRRKSMLAVAGAVMAASMICGMAWTAEDSGEAFSAGAQGVRQALTMEDQVGVEMAWTAGGVGISNLAAGSSQITVPNLPASFYDREGLDNMPVIDYSSMDVINVRDFGAVGDGQQDETNAFKAAVRHAIDEGVGPNKGMIIYVPEGIYHFTHVSGGRSAYWAINPDVAAHVGSSFDYLENLHFAGDGEHTVIRFMYLGIDQGNTFDSEHSPWRGWHFGGMKNTSVRDMTFTSFPYFDARHWYIPVLGIFAGDSAYPSEHLQFVNVRTDQTAIRTQSEANHTWVVDSSVMNTTADGISFYGSRNSHALYNYVENAGDDSLASWAQETGEHVAFMNNVVLGARFGRGLLMEGNHVLMKGNWLEQLTGTGMILTGNQAVSDRYITAQGNTVIRSALAFRPDNDAGLLGSPSARDLQGGIYIWGPDRQDIALENNRLFGGARNGITFRTGNVEGLTIKNNEVHRNLGAGLVVYDGVVLEDVEISGNSFLRNENQMHFADPYLPAVMDDVNIIGTLANSTVSGNTVSTAVALPGYTAVPDEPDYTDIYAQVRTDASETSWAAEPNIAAPSGLPVVNIASYGAVGDGVTNDFAALYAAIQALPNTGGRLIVPEGTYRIEPPTDDESKYTMPYTVIKHHLLIQDKANIHIEGEGAGSILRFTNPSYQGLRMINVSDSSVRSIRLELEQQPVTRYNRALLEVAASYDVELHQVNTANSSGPGIYINASTRVNVNQSKIEHAGTYGILAAAGRQIFITGNEVIQARDNGIQVSHFGGISREPHYIRIRENEVAGTREGAGIGVANGDHIEVLDNDVSATYLAGIHIYQSTAFFPLKQIKVRDNTLTDTNSGTHVYTGGAISFTMSAGKNEDNPILARIHVQGNAITNTPRHGIYIDRYKAVELIMEDNVIDNAAGDEVHRTMDGNGNYKSVILTYSVDGIGLPGPFSLEEDFEGSLDPGWILRQSGGVVEAVYNPDGPGKSLKLLRTDPDTATKLVRADYVFGRQLTGLITLEFKSRIESYGMARIPFIRDSSGTFAIRLSYRPNGQVQYSDGAVSRAIRDLNNNIMTYGLNQWVTAKLVIDVDANTFDLYWDGIKVAEQSQFVEPVSHIADLIFDSGTNSPVLYLDDVSIIQE